MIAAEDFSFAMQKDEVCHIQLPNPGFVYAPVAAGQFAGYAHIFVGNTAVGKVALYYGQTIEMQKDPPVPWWDSLFFGGNK